MLLCLLLKKCSSWKYPSGNDRTPNIYTPQIFVDFFLLWFLFVCTISYHNLPSQYLPTILYPFAHCFTLQLYPPILFTHSRVTSSQLWLPVLHSSISIKKKHFWNYTLSRFSTKRNIQHAAKCLFIDFQQNSLKVAAKKPDQVHDE